MRTLNDMSLAPHSTAWLSIVGVSAEGASALTEAARAALMRAELVAGSQRQLSLVDAWVKNERLVWPSPLSEGIAKLLARRGRSTCVLASGDPFWYGIGATLTAQLSPSEYVCHPAPSSLSLAAAKLGWPLQDIEVVSLHGRYLHTVLPRLQPGRRVLALSWNAETPSQLAELLTQRGFGPSRVIVLEGLAGPAERMREARASEYNLRDVIDLNVVAIEVEAERDALIIPCRGSLPDNAFEHDGQITKHEIRALTMSALAPYAGARLWDIGAGAGSIAIEWMLSHPACRAIAIERDAARCARIRRNAQALGVPALDVLQTEAPHGLEPLPAPDAIFIGGGAGDLQLFEHAWCALRSGGRLVINAVALETEALLVGWHAQLGGTLRRLSIERAEPLGSLTTWRPAIPVTQWSVRKP
jgi:precorrin-6Y C5,15-methyltransferase (decarboxylating)